jgi:hypothetical protein
MSDDLVRFNVLYGSVSFMPAAPGFTRTVTRDGEGRVIKDVTNHYVCLGVDRCMFCGDPMKKTA